MTEAKPERLLISYYYFLRNIKSFESLYKRLGYKPRIMLDSGAYTAWTKGIKIDLNDYCSFIERNKQYFEKYISLDVIGDGDASLANYELMLLRNLNPVPVFHSCDKWNILDEYAKRTDIIALAGLMHYRNDKRGMAGWINICGMLHMDKQYHVLGTTSKTMQGNCYISSMDSATWVMQSFMGNVLGHLDNSYNSKLQRAIYGLKNGLLLTWAVMKGPLRFGTQKSVLRRLR